VTDLGRLSDPLLRQRHTALSQSIHAAGRRSAETDDIVAARGLPEEGWEPGLPDDLAPYIEAQVWNKQPLLAYQEQMRCAI
jgi:hypothetical protein